MEKNINILAIETSCDETAASVIQNGNTVLSNIVVSQIESHKRFGGVVPEVASRHHVESITRVIEEALHEANVTPKELDAVAVTYGPGLIGALLVGVNAAKAFAFAHDLPLIPVHHIAGHIYANQLEHDVKFPLIALIVSGGHTELVKMEDHLQFEVIGETLDDAVGEAYDKVARVIGLPYPGGPEIDKLSKEGIDTYNFPRALQDEGYNFSFSGLKSNVINTLHNERQKNIEIKPANVAKSFQESVVDVLTTKTMRALDEENIKTLIVAGGVAANSGLRERFETLTKENGVELYIPSLKYCTDNAAMIGAVAYEQYKRGDFADLNLNGYNYIDIEDVIY
ncbi:MULTISPECIES: tRNA (adenosine(37)-N6)-threonylcarbamoyltransferase complex transferase subunit TsaD [Nosocomiicoccus]|uniref:tRNA N6-adenosine threonylcarbamoyltransferase n=1 Tax=Nosocomiicoccus massiliensis TaxID=1232430 RepID=A0AAF1BTH6_9STAP|nr:MULTISPECIES: tRNA (adenosine(37)-N6)-threonylcarbamoyltransferase complex transferase subunit TsaD [Nosocomiicoccus]MDK6863232.1 tRNA (adenosine(37)-N6)-threonylcarbamoyltransferase complex transferase subunit TsaD [Nosocomiicoccus ampullae]OFL46753.1 N(6)-L-threonylcarbamoyladenine synthase TsaD [Nosocomiicoccus sp. HMSC067E10]WOS96967.1 tRNA (adenosine(37)-N6)-threonylcarbamoyltransferase complex transferase subunit TsaD [Nosocomiicoccus massiliensis]